MDGVNDIPLGMSKFQIERFILNKESLPRIARTCLLQIRQKELALSESIMRNKRAKIDKDEKTEKLKHATGFVKKRLEVDLEEIEIKRDFEKKMIADCLEELKVYKNFLKKIPAFTREEFEAAELEYWAKRFIEDAKRELKSIGTLKTDTIKSLESLNFSVDRNEDNKIVLNKKISLKT
jgi:hypothetical protein